MKQYKVFKHPSGDIEAVKIGWSWPAFFFDAIWALVKKQWALGVTAFICFFALGFVLGGSGAGPSIDAIVNIPGFIFKIICGANGNSWREKNLISRGYVQVDLVTAANPESAVAQCLQQAGTAHNMQGSPKIINPHTGYQGGYSGGHNNPGGHAPTQGSQQSDGYRNGDLYK